MYEQEAAAGIFGMIWLIWLGLYLFFSFCQYKIAQKVEHHAPWYAFIPIVQVFQSFKMAGKDWWWIFLFLIPIVNIVAIAMIWMEIARRCGQSAVWGFLMLIPIINFVALLYLAFSAAPARPSYPQPARTPEKVPM